MEIYQYFNQKYFRRFREQDLRTIATLMTNNRFAGGDIKNACEYVFKTMGKRALQLQRWKVRYVANPLTINSDIEPVQDPNIGGHFPFLLSEQSGQVSRSGSGKGDVYRRMLIFSNRRYLEGVPFFDTEADSESSSAEDTFTEGSDDYLHANHTRYEIQDDVYLFTRKELQALRIKQRHLLQSVFVHSSIDTLQENLLAEMEACGLIDGNDTDSVHDSLAIEYVNPYLLCADMLYTDPALLTEEAVRQNITTNVVGGSEVKVQQKRLLRRLNDNFSQFVRTLFYLKHRRFPILNFFVQNVLHRQSRSLAQHSIYLDTGLLENKLYNFLLTNCRIGNVSHCVNLCDCCKKVTLMVGHHGRKISVQTNGEVYWADTEEAKTVALIPADFEAVGSDRKYRWFTPDDCAYAHPRAEREDYLSTVLVDSQTQEPVSEDMSVEDKLHRFQNGELEFKTWIPGRLVTSGEKTWFHDFSTRPKTGGSSASTTSPDTSGSAPASAEEQEQEQKQEQEPYYRDMCGRCYFQWYEKKVLEHGFAWIIENKYRYKKIQRKSQLNIDAGFSPPLTYYNPKRSKVLAFMGFRSRDRTSGWNSSNMSNGGPSKTVAVQHASEYVENTSLLFFRLKKEIVDLIQNFDQDNPVYVDLGELVRVCNLSEAEITQYSKENKNIRLPLVFHVRYQIPQFAAHLNLQKEAYIRCNFKLSNNPSMWAQLKSATTSASLRYGLPSTVGAVAGAVVVPFFYPGLIAIGALGGGLTALTGTVGARKVYNKLRETFASNLTKLQTLAQKTQQKEDEVLLVDGTLSQELSRAHNFVREFVDSMDLLICVDNVTVNQDGLSNFIVQTLNIKGSKGQLLKLKHCLAQNMLVDPEMKQNCGLGIDIVSYMLEACLENGDLSQFCSAVSSNVSKDNVRQIRKGEHLTVQGRLKVVAANVGPFLPSVKVFSMDRSSHSQHLLQPGDTILSVQVHRGTMTATLLNSDGHIHSHLPDLTVESVEGNAVFSYTVRVAFKEEDQATVFVDQVVSHETMMALQVSTLSETYPLPFCLTPRSCGRLCGQWQQWTTPLAS